MGETPAARERFRARTSSLPIFLYLFSFSGPFNWRSSPSHPCCQWALALLLSLVASAAVPALDLVYGIWTEEITPSSASSQAIRTASNQAGIIMLAVGCTQLLLFWTSMYLFMMSSETLTNRLRVAYVSALLAKDVDYFASHGPGELSSRIGLDVEQIRVGLGEKMAYVGQGAGIMVASTTLAFVRSPSTAAVLFPIVPILLAVFTGLGIASERIAAPAAALEGAAASYIEQVLSAPRIVHAFGATQRLVQRMDDAFLAPLSRWTKHKALIRSIELSSVYAVMLWLYGIFFAWGAHQISGQHATVGVAITAFWSFVNTFFSMANIVPHLGSIMQAVTSLKALRCTIEGLPSIDVRGDSGICITQDPHRVPSIHLQDVTFAYPSRPRIAALQSVTLTVEANKVTAFVGPSGSGKSTIAALLLREYDPETTTRPKAEATASVVTNDVDIEKGMPVVRNAGRIQYAGHDLRDLNIADYRSEIGIASQHVQLFTGTVLDNLAVGLTEAQSTAITGVDLRERAKEALLKAQAWGFVSKLPQGMDTPLRAGQSNMLSGGQRQRLALARALIREPTVLILDEATSALDSSTEEGIRVMLEKEQKKKNLTCCIIAHRLSTIRQADKIVVLVDGRVVDQGTHDELMQQDRHDETYRRMVLASTLGRAAQADDDGRDGSLVSSRAVDIVSSYMMGSDPPGSVSEAAGASDGEHSLCQREKGGSSFALPAATASESSVPLYKQAMASLWSKTKNRRLAFLVGSLAALIGSGVLPVSGFVTGEGIAAISSGDLDYVRARGYFWALIFLALGFAAVTLYSIQGYYFEEASSYVSMILKRDSLRAVMSQSITYFDMGATPQAIGEQESDKGVLPHGSAANLSQHPASVTNGISVALGQSILCLGNATVCFGIGLGLSPKLALVAFAPLLLLPPLSYVTVTRLQGAEKYYGDRAERCSVYLSEQIDNIRTLTALGRQLSVLATFEEKARVVGILGSRRSLLLGTLAFAAGQSFMLIPSALIFWYSGILLAESDVAIAAIYGVFEVQIIAGFGVSRIVTLIPDISRALTSSQIVAGWLNLGKQKGTAGSSNPPDVAGDDRFHVGDLTFENVQLYYPQRPEHPALKGVNLTIRKGTTVALVGTSGSGKSTLLSLLSRFYDPSYGRVLLDGRDLKSLDVGKVRNSFALVSQDAVLFQGSVRENVALGAVRADQTSDESVRFACVQAGICDFVESLPDGFDTEIGLKGLELSGGQRQRLCIARALIRSPEVLLLDETTSALDAESEAVVQTALDKASKGRTTIMVAHRLSTVRNADCIHVFEEGNIIESGTHEQLLEARGRYLELIEAQL